MCQRICKQNDASWVYGLFCWRNNNTFYSGRRSVDRTASLVSDCKKAKAQKAIIATLTICPEAPIGEMADAIITIPGATQKNAEHTNDVVTEQPGGNLFEQLSWLIYDSIVMDLMPILGETEDTMFKRHANME